MNEEGMMLFPYPWRLRRGSMLAALHGSLSRLGIERVDLYQIHWPIPGAKNADQARENAGALGWSLARAEAAALDDASGTLSK